MNRLSLNKLSLNKLSLNKQCLKYLTLLLFPPCIIFSPVSCMQHNPNRQCLNRQCPNKQCLNKQCLKHIPLDQFLEKEKEDNLQGDYLQNEEYKKEYLRIFNKVSEKPIKFDKFVNKEIPNFLYQSQEDPKNKAILDAFFDVILKKPNRLTKESFPKE